MLCGAFFLYSTQYFEKLPTEYYCKETAISEWKTCDLEEACKDTTYSFKPDKESEGYLENWAEQMDLYCKTKVELGFIGSFFFIGTFIGAFILPRASDIYGRKPLFLIGLVIFFGVVMSSYWCTSLYVLYFI